MPVATATGTVYLIIANEKDNQDHVVAVFGTKPEAQGFCFRHEPHFYWVARTIWAWPEIVDPSLPGYYAASLSDQEYDLARPPATE